jgi:hypothetical protein
MRFCEGVLGLCAVSEHQDVEQKAESQPNDHDQARCWHRDALKERERHASAAANCRNERKKRCTKGRCLLARATARQDRRPMGQRKTDQKAQAGGRAGCCQITDHQQNQRHRGSARDRREIGRAAAAMQALEHTGSRAVLRHRQRDPRRCKKIRLQRRKRGKHRSDHHEPISRRAQIVADGRSPSPSLRFSLISPIECPSGTPTVDTKKSKGR